MTQEIMTGNGPLQPHPSFTAKVSLQAGEAQITIAKGDNGYWYICIEDVEDVSEQLCAQRFEPTKRFHHFVMTDGLAARQYWNRRLGQGYEQHVHFTSTQTSYEGTWAIYDLGQAFAAHVDQSFAARVHAVYRQYEQGIYHDDETTRHTIAEAPGGNLPLVEQIGQALIHLAQEARKTVQALEHETRRNDIQDQQLTSVHREMNAIRTIAQQAVDAQDYITIESYVRLHRLEHQLPPGRPQALYGEWLSGYCLHHGIQIGRMRVVGQSYGSVHTYPISVIDQTLPGYLRDVYGQGRFNF